MTEHDTTAGGPERAPQASEAAKPDASKRTGSRFGPGLIIAASFIGPGTLTTSIVTGASYGFALAWTIVFSIFATIVLQEMSVRLGLATKMGLGTAMRAVFHSPIMRLLMAVLVVAAIGIGGAAYAGGDTVGTALAITTVSGAPQWVAVAIILLGIFAVLASGKYKVVERVLMIMVGILALTFIITTLVVLPNVGDLLRGIFVPTVPEGAALQAIALIGTTVVPYNVFLHASLAQENWGHVKTEQGLKEARVDTAVSISIGGFITLIVMSTAVGAMYVEGLTATSGEDLSGALRPLLGEAAPWFFAVGLFAAGFTSAVAGPLGAAYAITGTLGLNTNMKSLAFRVVWIGVLLIGGFIALLDLDAVELIVVAQAANGLLLPIVAIFLMVTMNNKKLLGKYRNGPLTNTIGAVVVIIVVGLGAYQLADLFELI